MYKVKKEVRFVSMMCPYTTPEAELRSDLQGGVKYYHGYVLKPKTSIYPVARKVDNITLAGVVIKVEMQKALTKFEMRPLG